MRLYKRGKIWWYELVFEGRRVQQSTKVRDRRAAGQIASAHHLALAKGEAGIFERKPAPTLEVAMKAFLNWSLQEHASHPATAERYRYSSLPILAHFPKQQPIDRISPEDVENYKQKRSAAKRKDKQQLRPATVNRELACLRAMFNYAIKKSPEIRNPISKITGVKLLAENNQQDRVLTYAEETRYLAKCSTTLRDVATMILKTGMRPEEIYTLQAAHVDLEGNYLRVLKGKTPAARRRIELTELTREILERRITAMEKAALNAEKPAADWLFPNADDSSRPMPGVQSAHGRALKESKVQRFRPYDLRHTWATRAAEAGVDPITLAAMMGHSRIQMVLRYAHPSQDHQIGAMAKVVAHEVSQRAKEKAKADHAEAKADASGLRLIKSA